MKPLVIVESPTKARTISKLLGDAFHVEASNGHVRDLPKNAKDLPAGAKKEGWTSLGIKIKKGFEPLYVVPSEKEAHVKRLKDALRNASELYLATDEDREGESISWHLLELLKPRVPHRRLVFHEITKDAITRALQAPREIDINLVRAQEARRILDRLYGFQVSEVLWRKVQKNLSAGRVQSVVVRLLVELERERLTFVKASYWTLKGFFENARGESFDAELAQVGNKRVAIGKDFDPKTGQLKVKDNDNVLWLKEADVAQLLNSSKGIDAAISSVEEKPYTTKPFAPFVTSSLQQEANRKLSYSASRTMSIAQKLYESGFITYMRTDSTALSEQAISAARSTIDQFYGKEYLPASPRVYKTSVKNAQEAHEAIRPAGDSFADPAKVRKVCGEEAFRIYDMIWKRTVACQMSDARGKRINVGVQLGELLFKASGKTIEFPGFLRAYVEGSDDPDAELADKEKILPVLQKGEIVSPSKLEPAEKNTMPPARYTEGSLIKELELRGIGRPSTWATVVETVVARNYVFRKGNQLVPSLVAFAVSDLLQKHFTHLVDYAFTAKLEDELDAISRGEGGAQQYLEGFYFGGEHPGLAKMLEDGFEKIDPREASVVNFPLTFNRKIDIRAGKSGPYLTDGELSVAVPPTLLPDELTAEKVDELLEMAKLAASPICVDPKTGKALYFKIGPYGPYIQSGETGEEGVKYSSLAAGTTFRDVTPELALKVTALPRNLGINKKTDTEVVVGIGKFGPYVKCGDAYRAIPKDATSVLDIELEEAVKVFEAPKYIRGLVGGVAEKKPEGRLLGINPETNKKIFLKNGRYGNYFTDGDTNVTYKGDVDSVNLEEAIELLAEKAFQTPPKKSRKSSTTKKKVK